MHIQTYNLSKLIVKEEIYKHYQHDNIYGKRFVLMYSRRYIELQWEGTLQPSLNAAIFHPTIQAKAKPPKNDRDHIEIPRT